MGSAKRYRYRFTEPITQPSVIMMGFHDRLIPPRLQVSADVQPPALSFHLAHFIREAVWIDLMGADEAVGLA